MFTSAQVLCYLQCVMRPTGCSTMCMGPKMQLIQSNSYPMAVMSQHDIQGFTVYALCNKGSSQEVSNCSDSSFCRFRRILAVSAAAGVAQRAPRLANVCQWNEHYLRSSSCAICMMWMAPMVQPSTHAIHCGDREGS